MAKGTRLKTKKKETPPAKLNQLEDLDKIAFEIMEIRKRPLLILYYPNGFGAMEDQDIDHIYNEFRRQGFQDGTLIEKIDVLLHTFGGNPHAAYRIGQLIRNFSQHVTILIPRYAYSGGTLLCLSANQILLGANATLSPIDIQLRSNREQIELISIDYYIEFAKHCRTQFEEAQLKTDLEKELLTTLVKQVTALTIGQFFRMRSLTKYYSEVLLESYMFKECLDKEQRTDHIVEMLLFKFPTHDFNIDFHVASTLGLFVEEMTLPLSDKTREYVDYIQQKAKQNIVCKLIGKRRGKQYRLPFFRLYILEELAR